jgi:flagellar biosynthesis repressor protein FlbT
VDTPARRIYFALQSAYIGTEMEREGGLDSARHFIADFQQATTSDLIRAILDQALVAAEEDDCYQALKLIRRVIQHEDAVLGKTPNVSIPTGNNDRHVEREPCHTGL